MQLTGHSSPRSNCCCFMFFYVIAHHLSTYVSIFCSYHWSDITVVTFVMNVCSQCTFCWFCDMKWLSLICVFLHVFIAFVILEKEFQVILLR